MQTLKFGSRGDDVKVLQRALHLLDDGIFGSLTLESVISFQKDNGLVADGIVGKKTWELLMPNVMSAEPKSKRTINEIIVHCTATPEGRPVTIEEITNWHKARGFSTIGYHYVIMLDGSVRNGRDVNVSGAHCVNHNSHSIGVCYVGGLTKDGKWQKDTRTNAQKQTLLALLKRLRTIYPYAKIYGHRNFSNKDCPCFDAKNEYKNI